MTEQIICPPDVKQLNGKALSDLCVMNHEWIAPLGTKWRFSPHSVELMELTLGRVLYKENHFIFQIELECIS